MALPMPDDVIDKLHRMAQQQKNNPGLVFADRNLNPDEYEDNEDDKTYHDNNSGEDEDKEVLSYDKEEDDDVHEDEEEAHGPPARGNEAAPRPPVVENDDDINDDDNGDVAGQADEQQPAEAEQPGNPPGEIAGMGVANQGGGHDEAIFPENQGVVEEVIEPETPGVGTVQENEEGKNEDDQLVEFWGLPP